MAGSIPNIERTFKIHQGTISPKHAHSSLVIQYPWFLFTNEKTQVKRLHKKTGSNFLLYPRQRACHQ